MEFENTKHHKYNIYLKPGNQAAQSFHLYSWFKGPRIYQLYTRSSQAQEFPNSPHLLHLKQTVGKFCFPKASLLSDFNTCVGHSDTGRVKERMFAQDTGFLWETEECFLRRNRHSRVFCFYLFRYLYKQLARLEVMACCFCDRLTCHGELDLSHLKEDAKCLSIQVLIFL